MVRHDVITYWYEVKSVETVNPFGDKEESFFRRYCIARAHRPDVTLPCHICLKKKPDESLVFIKSSKLKHHCRRRHPRFEFKCEYTNCDVYFENAADKGRHTHYVHQKSHAWWWSF